MVMPFSTQSSYPTDPNAVYQPDPAISQEYRLADVLRNQPQAKSLAGVFAQGIGAIGGNMLQSSANQAQVNNQALRAQALQAAGNATDVPALSKALLSSGIPDLQTSGLNFGADYMSSHTPLDIATKQATLESIQKRNATEGKSFTTIGTDALGNPRYGVVDLNKSNGGVAQGAPSTDVSAVPVNGDAYLDKLTAAGVPPTVSNLVKSIANYDQPPVNTRSKQGMAIMNMVAQFRPDYNATNYNTISATRKNFTSGTDAANTAAFNTAIEHAQGLLAAEKSLGNSDYPLVNPVRNFVRNQAGNKAYQSGAADFKMHAEGLATELDKAFKGAGAADVAGIQGIKEALGNPDTPPAAVESAVKKAMTMLAARITQQREKYNRGMMTTDQEMPMFSPDSAKALDAILGDGTAAGLNATLAAKGAEPHHTLNSPDGGGEKIQGQLPPENGSEAIPTAQTKEDAAKMPVGTPFLFKGHKIAKNADGNFDPVP